MAVDDVSSCQHAVIEFLVKENSSGADIFSQLCHLYIDSCMDASSVQHFVKHFKDGSRGTTVVPHSG
jgi:hypothetical protein